MDIYTGENYKDTLRIRLKGLQKDNKSLTLKKIASEVPIQYTYLSKTFNDAHTHLNEDNLFTICRILKFTTEETDYLSLQRSHDICDNLDRKRYLSNKIEKMGKNKKTNATEIEPNSNRLTEEMNYLFNSTCVLVHTALYLERIRENPLILCEKFNLTINQLKEILKTLSINEFIKLDEDGLTVSGCLGTRFRFGRDHPLMRVHQTILKTAIQTRIQSVEEDKKHSTLVTFTMDRNGFTQAREEFRTFLKKIEQIKTNSTDSNVYQMSFDLFEWL